MRCLNPRPLSEAVCQGFSAFWRLGNGGVSGWQTTQQIKEDRRVFGQRGRMGGAQAFQNGSGEGEERRWYGFTCWDLEILALGGFTQLADSTELSITKWILPVLETEWGVDDSQKALMGTAKSVAMGLGSIAAGVAADKWGRRPTFIACLALVTLGGLCSVFAPNFWTFCACRVVTSAGSAAIALSYSILAELLSTAPCRDRALMLVGPFWGLGGCVCDKAAGVLTQQTDGSAPRWREFLALMVAPMLLLLLWARARLPETPVWLQAQENRAGVARASETTTTPVVVVSAPGKQLHAALLAADDDDDDACDDSGDDTVPPGGALQRCDSFHSAGRAAIAASPWAQVRLLLCGALAQVTWSVLLLWGSVFGAFGYDVWFVQLGERAGIPHPAMVNMTMLSDGPVLVLAVLSAVAVARAIGASRVLLLGIAVQGISCMALSACLHSYTGGPTLVAGALFLTYEAASQFALAALRVVVAAVFPAEQRASGFGLCVVAQTSFGVLGGELTGMLTHDTIKYGLLLASFSALALAAGIAAMRTARSFAAATAAEGGQHRPWMNHD